MVILDTCALVHLCLADECTISDQVQRIIAEGAYILSVSFVEIARKIKAGKLEIGCSPRELLKEYRSVDGIKIADVSPENFIHSAEIDWHHKDPADRLIVSFAMQEQVPIVTSDREIIKFYNKTLW
jgi:PIN domain nuclease of toxin-antitoxin system